MWLSFLGSSALFGATDGGNWLANTLAGMFYALALYQRRELSNVVAHAAANARLAIYVFARGYWSFWSLPCRRPSGLPDSLLPPRRWNNSAPRRTP